MPDPTKTPGIRIQPRAASKRGRAIWSQVKEGAALGIALVIVASAIVLGGGLLLTIAAAVGAFILALILLLGIASHAGLVAIAIAAVVVAWMVLT